MKTWMFALLGVTPSLVAWNYAVAEEAAPTPKVFVMSGAQAADGQFQWVSEDGTAQVMVVSGNGEPGEVRNVNVLVDPQSGDREVVVTAQASGDGRSESTVKNVRVLARGIDPDAAQRGWLGVSIENISEAKSGQAGVAGVMVLNVVEGSPADTAGLEANDVIVSINGQAVGNEVGPAVDLIKNRKPGETINIGIVREGKPMTVSATLGSRAEMGTFEWKFEGLPAQIEEQVKTRGKFMMRSPDGQIIVKDLGDLHDLKNLPENIRMFVPQSGTRSTQVTVNNGQKTIKTHIEIDNDGSSLNIEQSDGGPITVTRTDAQGQSSTETYADAEALKAADEEAYEVYSNVGKQVFVRVLGDDEDGHAPQILLHGGNGSGEWRMHLEQNLAEAKEAYGAAMEELHTHLMELKNQGAFDVEKFHEAINAGGAKAFSFQMGRPTHRFTVNPDGSIEATLRKGDSEVVQKFYSESDLAQRRPDLYEKYQNVKAAGEE